MGEKGRLKIEYADIVAISALIATVMIAVCSVLPNMRAMALNSRFSHYSELDRMYNELLRCGIEYPSLRGRWTALTFEDDDARGRYEAYAFMIWNFVETVHDRCEEDDRLCGTWAPIVGAEFALHHRWFRRETEPYRTRGAPKFCVQFCDFIWRGFLVANAIPPTAMTARQWRYRTPAEISRSDAVAAFYRGDAPGERQVEAQRDTMTAQQPDQPAVASDVSPVGE